MYTSLLKVAFDGLVTFNTIALERIIVSDVIIVLRS